MNQKKIFNMMTFLCLLMVVGCSPSTVRLKSTASVIISATPNVTETPTSTATPSATLTASPTPSVEMNLSGLPAGIYALYESSFRSDTDTWGVVSIDGKYQKIIMTANVFTKSVIISADQTRLIILNVDHYGSSTDKDPYMVNLQTGQSENVPAFPLGCWSLSLAPNAKAWIGMCWKTGNEELYYQSGEALVRITNCAALNDECYPPSWLPAWSPDGKWILYFRQAIPKGGSFGGGIEGFILVPSSCVSKPFGCTTSGGGIFAGVDNAMYRDYSWSPDSQLLAFNLNDQILIYKPTFRT